MQEKFTDILIKYSSIDTSFGSDKNTSHSYGSVYDTYFSEYKEKAENILEIGFDGGFSLLAYNDYFTNAKIYGIDIKNGIKANFQDKGKERIQYFIGDALENETINQAFPKETKFDIIIEDGSHDPSHQIQHFRDFCPYVKEGGIYIIEDINGYYFQTVKENIEKIANENSFSLNVHDLRGVKRRFDDILIVLKKI
jgi:predicted O-methyltransferase YrrM